MNMDLRIGKDRFRPMEDEPAIGRSTEEMVEMQRMFTVPKCVADAVSEAHAEEMEKYISAVENACADLRRALGREN